jgi:hypothetical protein
MQKIIASEEDLTRRAFAAWFRTGDGIIDQPSNHSGVIEHNGKLYVRLLNTRGTLAVYRVLTNGMLKRLKRWPAAIDEY